MKKNNRELNKEHEKKELMRVRPKTPDYQFDELEKVVHQWVRTRLEAHE